MEIIYSYDQALEDSTKYFNGNEFAARIFLDKYALRNENNEIIENTPEKMHRRLAKEYARIEKNKFKNPLSEEFIFNLFDKFDKIINQGSPCYAIGNNYTITSSSNCFVVDSPEDSYGGICKTDEELAQISKRRGGNGVDISSLRPNKSPTKNSSRTSTGIIPFVGRYSNTIREVGQDGRRGALMLSCSIHHPESVIPWEEEHGLFETTIKSQSLGEYKISSIYFNPNIIDFATAKYDTTKVTGANISLRLSDEFLNSVENGTTFEQRWPIDSKTPKISKKVSAKKVWDKIIYSAWRTAEPGILFWDNIIKESPADCYSKFGFSTISTNPCGEIPLSAYDSCRLMVLNLMGFVKNPFTAEAYFDYKEFFETSKIAQRLMDDMVDLELEFIEKIIAKIKSDPEPIDIKIRELELWEKIKKSCSNGRRTGTGITALGDTLAALGIPYGSKRGIEEVDKIYKTLKFGCYYSSVQMAKEIGPFPIFDYELEKNNPFLNRFKNEYLKFDDGTIISGMDLYEIMKKIGRRNIALLTTAPVGTVSNLAKLVNMYGSTSGIEPLYSDVPYIRKKKGNPSDVNFRTDSIDQNGDHWMHFKIYPIGLQEWMNITGETDIKKSPWYNNCAENINWKLRVELQATAQRHVDHSISSTVNLPETATVEDVKEIYETAWKLGCKGITVYRDKCRTGVLTKENSIPDNHAVKRPKELKCDVHHVKVKGEDFFVLIGLLNDYPYEIFAGRNGKISHCKRGNITKIKRGHYAVKFEDSTELENVCDLITDEQAAICRLISLVLRHNININYSVDQLEKVPGDMTNFAKSVSRALKKYIKDGSKVTGMSCESCEGPLIRQEGCVTCKLCGWSKCS